MSDAAPPLDPVIAWHDVECGGYDADIALWHELAALELDAGRPGVLDVGAGTGRVAISLARAGHDVCALDLEPVLLAALEERAAAAGVRVATVVADAGAFALGRRFGMIAVPMQTIQLLPDRPGFFAAARAHLAPGGLLALAIAIDLEAFDARDGLLPAPDEGTAAGWRFASQAVAVVPGPRATRIERIRRIHDPGGHLVSEEPDRIDLARVSVAGLRAEGRAAGLDPVRGRRIAATEEHVGSEGVLFRG